MKHYITPNNTIFGFDESQIDLIPVGAVEILDTILMEQIPYIDFNNGEPLFNQEKYNLDNQKKLLEQNEKNLLLNKFKTLGFTDEEIKQFLTFN